MGIHRSPIADFAPNSPATMAYQRLWADIAARIWS